MKSGKLVKATTKAIILGMLAMVLLVSDSQCSPAKSPDMQKAVNPQAREFADQLSGLFESAASDVQGSVVPIYSEQEVEVSSPFGFSGDPFKQFFGDGF